VKSAPISRELLHKVKLLELRTRLQVRDVFSGRYHSIFKGQGMDFAEVREYTPGDDIRAIDWNVSARMGHPYVKLYREERELTIMLLVDVSGSTEFGTQNVLKREVSAELTALLALCALTNNDKVGLILFTDKIEHFVAPKKGRRHVLRLIRDVLAFKPSSKGTSVQGAVEFALHALRKKSVLFLISDFEGSGWEKPVRIAGRKHDLVAVELFDPRERTLPSVGVVQLLDPETGETVWIDTSSEDFRHAFSRDAAVKAIDRAQFFRSCSIDRIELSVDKPYIMELIKFFRSREQRR
jgi:uncharacterized protein (DUF58 family)